MNSNLFISFVFHLTGNFVQLLSASAIFGIFFWKITKNGRKYLVIYLCLASFFIAAFGAAFVSFFGAQRDTMDMMMLLLSLATCISTLLLVNASFSKIIYASAIVYQFAFFISRFTVRFAYFSEYIVEDDIMSILLLKIIFNFGAATILIPPISKWIVPLFIACDDKRTWLHLSLSPLIYTSAMFIATVNALDYNTGNYMIWMLVTYDLSFVAAMTGNVVAARSISTMIKLTEYEHELDVTDKLLDIQREQYRKLSENISQTKAIRHDIRHHLTLIDGFAQKGDLDALRRYLADRSLPASFDRELVICENRTANILAGHYIDMALERGIDISVSLAIDNSCHVKDNDLCVLLGNCLENSIEACEVVPEGERFIRVSSHVSGAYLYIIIKNSFDGSFELRDGHMLSKKSNFASRGIGSESVAAIVRQYGGEIKYEHEGKVFTVSLMLGDEINAD